MKKFIGLLIAVLSIFTNCLANEIVGTDMTMVCPEKRPMICTMDYNPVCGLRRDKSIKTYSNACGACADQKVISHVAKACPERILSSEELIELFSGNTYVAVIPSRKLKMTVYVDPDGTMKGMQSGHKFTSKWEINDKGEICVSYKDKMSCRVVMEQEGVYKKFKINEKGEKVVLVIYQSFAAGNVHNY
ncbi:MAG: hypothetical protein QM504_02425 [Pseudomonadota bacterium]